MFSLVSCLLYSVGQPDKPLVSLHRAGCRLFHIWMKSLMTYYQGFRVGSSRALSVCFPVLLFYIPGFHLKFMLPPNTHIGDWDLISHDPFIHDPLLMNTSDPFLIFPFSITSQVTFTTIHFSTTFTEIQTKTDLNFEKVCQL